MSKYRLGSLFAGIGGIDLGFNLAGFLPVWANEFDPYCAETFNANHKQTSLLVKDICLVTSKDIPDIDILAGGFPCQPFSIAGFKKGFEDERGNLFFQIIRIIKELKAEDRQPKVIFLENVKNMFSHNDGKTYSFMKEKLQDLGYSIKEKILNTCEYGNIPQNRERLYIVAFLNKIQATKFDFPAKIELTNTINKCIGFDNVVDSKYYYTPNNCKSYQLLEDSVKTCGSIYQFRRVYIRENKSGVCPTLTANMGTGGHNVPIILDTRNKIRKLTPRECLLVQGFPSDFVIPKTLTDSRIYKQAGNSVSINVIKRIAQNILEVLENEQETNTLR
jgi:DNA (cytosine-5)-methyltransferase 1